MLTTERMLEKEPSSAHSGCQCGGSPTTTGCQSKILHSLLSFPYTQGGGHHHRADTLEHPPPTHRAVPSPSGSTGSCCNSPRHSPNPSTGGGREDTSSAPTSSKLFLLLNGPRRGKSPVAPPMASHPAGAALDSYPRVIPSPGAASTCSSTASDGGFPPYSGSSPHHPRNHYQDPHDNNGLRQQQQQQPQEQPLNLKRSYQTFYTSGPRPTTMTTVTPGAVDLTTTTTQDGNNGNNNMAAADQPMDLSCKKRRRLSISSTSSDESGLSGFSLKRETASPSTGSTSSGGEESILKSILCGGGALRRGYDTPCPSPHYSLPPSPLSQHSSGSGFSPRDSHTSSILSGILHPHLHQGAGSSPRHGGDRFPGDTHSSRPGSRCSTPGSASSFRGTAPGAPTTDKRTTVTLSKKNLFPVTRGVTDWLVEIIHFARSQPEFSTLPHSDQISILQHSWSRLLLLCMAENDFKFAVTPTSTQPPPSPAPSDCGPGDALRGLQDADAHPTMRDVETIERLINKCHHGLGLDTDEYTHLKKITLFNQGCLGAESSEYIDSVNTMVRQSLQRHTARCGAGASHPGGAAGMRRYSQLLLLLPTLFGINSRMMEHLFCRPIIGDQADMEVLLKGMLLKL